MDDGSSSARFEREVSGVRVPHQAEQKVIQKIVSLMGWSRLKILKAVRKKIDD